MPDGSHEDTKLHLLKIALRDGKYDEARAYIDQIVKWFDDAQVAPQRNQDEQERLAALVAAINSGWRVGVSAQTQQQFLKKELLNRGHLTEEEINDLIQEWFKAPAHGPVSFLFETTALEAKLLGLLSYVRTQRGALPKNKGNVKAKRLLDQAVRRRLNALHLAVLNIQSRVQNRLVQNDAQDSAAIGAHIYTAV